MIDLSVISTVIIVANVLIGISIVFFERRDPTTALAWLLVLLLVPYLGFVLYLIFGQRYHKQKLFQDKVENDRFLQQYLLREKGECVDQSITAPGAVPDRYRPMIQMLRDVQVYITRDNLLGVYTNGYDLYHDLFNAIQSARHHIHIEVYIIRNDETGRRFISALAERARDGLEVRLLYDDVGGLKLPLGFFDEILSAGGSVANFLPSLIPRINLRANFRNHRKIAVFDGDTGFVGGYNIGDEYLGKDKAKGFWRDTHLKVQGSAVFSLQLQFIEDWNFSVKEKLVIQPQYFPPPRVTGTAPVQVASGGPDTKWNKIKDALLRMIYGAEESIYIESPYFIPDMSMLDALRVASLSGVDVRLIIPNKPDHPFVHWASRSYAGELMDAGVRTYIYENGFIHSKMVVVDGSVATIGSTNWDIRSFKLNFETNAFIYDRNFANTLKEIFVSDLDHCVELTHDIYARRSVFIRMKESVSRLLSPIL